jgi:hypothetical protein
LYTQNTLARLRNGAITPGQSLLCERHLRIRVPLVDGSCEEITLSSLDQFLVNVKYISLNHPKEHRENFLSPLNDIIVGAQQLVSTLGSE